MLLQFYWLLYGVLALPASQPLKNTQAGGRGPVASQHDAVGLHILVILLSKAEKSTGDGAERETGRQKKTRIDQSLTQNQYAATLYHSSCSVTQMLSKHWESWWPVEEQHNGQTVTKCALTFTGQPQCARILIEKHLRNANSIKESVSPVITVHLKSALLFGLISFWATHFHRFFFLF